MGHRWATGGPQVKTGHKDFKLTSPQEATPLTVSHICFMVTNILTGNLNHVDCVLTVAGKQQKLVFMLLDDVFCVTADSFI